MSHRAQIDELQKKQDQLNSFKNSKLFSSTNVHASRETYGESPLKRSVPLMRSSRSLSFNRPLIKRLTAVKRFDSFQFSIKSFWLFHLECQHSRSTA